MVSPNRAVKDRLLGVNPAQGVDNLPRLPRGDKRFLTHEQVAQLADAAGERARLVILVLAFCGLRFGELAALRVRRVDLMRRRLEVAESVTEVGGVATFGSPKAHQSRSVPLPRFVVEELAEHITGRGPDEFVFPAPGGGVLRLMNWRRRVFDPAARAAGLEGLTPHELRHTAVSLAIAAGASPKDVQRMVGHASAAVTLDVYAGLFEDSLDDVAARMDAAARAAADSVRTGGQVVRLPASVSAGQSGWAPSGSNRRPAD